MRLQPIVYTADMDAAVNWYAKVLDVEPAFRSEMWTAIPAGDATLGIHHVSERADGSNVAISLIATEPLEAVIGRLATVGIDPAGPIEDQPFGRSVLLRDPDGAPVQVNEHAH